MSVADERAACAALTHARRAGLPRIRAAESALMLVLHAGYPAALEGARVLNEAWPGRSRRTREGAPADWLRRGTALARRVYGTSYPNLVRNVTALHPDLARWMIEQGYGRVLSRPGLDGRARELVAVAVLAAGGWERQLVSHLLGARRLGAPLRDVRSALRIGRARCAPRRRAACDRAWRVAFGT
jgi:4-carboxymuconolactone decarboxylase